MSDELFDSADKNDFQNRYWIPTIWIENLPKELKIASAEDLVQYTINHVKLKKKVEACCTRFERCPTTGKLHAHLFIKLKKSDRLWAALIAAFGPTAIKVLYARRDGENAKSYSVKDETSEGEPAFHNIDPESIKPWGILGGKAGTVQKGTKPKDTKTPEEKAISFAEAKMMKEAAEQKLIRAACSSKNWAKFDFSFFIRKRAAEHEAAVEEAEMRLKHLSAEIDSRLIIEYGKRYGYDPISAAELYYDELKHYERPKVEGVIRPSELPAGVPRLPSELAAGVPRLPLPMA